MATETIRNGQIIRLNILPGQSVAVVAVSGTYNASIVQGAGIGVIATNATGATYGPYASGIAINLTASAASEIDFDIDVTPLIVRNDIIPPGTPIGEVAPGSGAFTTLEASALVAFTGDYGTQLKLGRAGQAGKLELLRSSDGAASGSIGFSSATTSDALDIGVTTGASLIRLLVNRSSSGFGEVLRASSLNDGSIGIGVSAPSSRLHLIAGAAAAGRAPFKLTAGVNLTVVENGAFEFDGTALFFTHGGIRRTITMA